MEGIRSRGSALARAAALALPLCLPAPRAGAEAAGEPLAGFAAPGAGLPLLGTLGDHTRPITTASRSAQRYFDQGLRFLYAFDQEAAYRSFARAMESDPGCAMCAWGMAAALGPNVNVPVTPGRIEAGDAAARQALALSEGATAAEQALVEAMAERYARPAPADPEGRRALDAAYAQAMGEVAEAFPDDADVQTLAAEAWMLLSPWNYWTPEGQPREHTPRILAVLERAIAIDPGHPGALHLTVHALEAGPHADAAVPAAEALDGAVPGAGHLAHMPSHIYARVGRYGDAADANERAIAADRAYREVMEEGPIFLFYSAHNDHFLAFAAAMEGRYDLALEAARALLREIPLDTFRHMEEMDGMVAMPVLVQVRFGRWEALLGEPPPPGDMAYPTALWHMGRGLAFAHTGRPDRAEEELGEVERALRATPAGERKGLGTTADLLGIASNVLAAAVAEARGETEDAIHLLRRAVTAEDRLTYMEPPDWWPPVRHTLGAVLLDAGRPEEAEAVYREDLERNRENGWALGGLAQALRAQGRDAEAEPVEDRAREAFQRADEVPKSSRW